MRRKSVHRSGSDSLPRTPIRSAAQSRGGGDRARRDRDTDPAESLIQQLNDHQVSLRGVVSKCTRQARHSGAQWRLSALSHLMVGAAIPAAPKNPMSCPCIKADLRNSTTMPSVSSTHEPGLADIAACCGALRTARCERLSFAWLDGPCVRTRSHILLIRTIKRRGDNVSTVLGDEVCRVCESFVAVSNTTT